MTDDPIAVFWRLCDDVRKIWEKEVGTRELEPTLLRILELVRSTPSHRQQFVAAFNEIVRREYKGSGRVPHEVLVFCMRELRWDAVRQSVIDERGRAEDPRVQSVMDQILEVFDDEWPDADLYEYYSRK
jgi:hypothetical protein